MSGKRPLVALLWGLAVADHAGAAQPSLPPSQCQVESLPTPSTVDGWERMLSQLAPLQAACEEHADFLALLGAAQLFTGRTNAALATLERAILRNPTLGGAQVDYALALQRSGQPFAALALNRKLLERNDLPSGLAEVLRERAHRWEAGLGRWRHRLHISFGHDDNLNAAPDLKDTTLTLPDLSIELPLSSSARAQAGWTQTTSWQGHFQQKRVDGRRLWEVNTSHRATEGDFDSLQLLARVEQQWELDTGRLDLAGQTQYLRYADESLYQGTGFETAWSPGHQEGGQCQLTLQAEATYQAFRVDSTLNGVELSAGPAWRCQRDELQWLMGASYLANLAADDDRVGGDRHGWEGQLRLARQMGNGAAALGLEALHLDDRGGYSPLLEGGSRRRIERYQARLQYQYPLGKSLSLLASAHYRHQESSIPLFEFSGTQYELGLSWRW